MPGEMQIARIDLGNGRFLYVTPRRSLPGTRREQDQNWLNANAHHIAVNVAQARADRWFGISVAQYDAAEKIDWVENNIRSGSLGVFITDPGAMDS